LQHSDHVDLVQQLQHGDGVQGYGLVQEKYKSTDISGNYSEFAKALGGYSERVTEPSQVAHALVNGIAATKQGKPVLLEFITTQDKVYSTFQGGYNGGA